MNSTDNNQNGHLTDGFNRSSNDRIKIGLFMPYAEDGSNVVANRLARKIVAETSDIDLILFITKQDKPKIMQRVEASPVLKQRKLLHGDLLKNVIFPFLEERETQGSSNPQGILLSPNLLKTHNPKRVSIENVDDPNDPAFVKRIREDLGLRMAFSVRNLVIFKDQIIKAFNDKAPHCLLNIHPANLPGIRGLDGPWWTRRTGGERYVATMHAVDQGIDTGPIFDKVGKAVNGDSAKSVAAVYRNMAPSVADMIFRHIEMVLINGESRNPVNHSRADSIFRTLPTDEEIKMGEEDLGINFDSARDQLLWLAENFSNRSDMGHYADLTADIHEYYNVHTPAQLRKKHVPTIPPVALPDAPGPQAP